MSSGSRGASKIARSLASSTPIKNHVCLSCRQTLARRSRSYASAATAEATVEMPLITQMTPDHPSASPLNQPRFSIRAGVVLSRPPLITPDPHPFETAYYLYQRRLNERLVLPFTQYFYYKRGTPSFEHWRTKRRERGGVATRDIGPYNAYTKESWNDEVLVGNKDGEAETIVKNLIEEEGRAGEFVKEGDSGDVKLAGLRRSTEADKTNDQRSLERALSRTLYLLVKRKGKSEEHSSWGFPSAPVAGKEGLREGAHRILGSSCGVNMNTWFVGSHPVGHLVLLNSDKELKHSKKDQKDAKLSESVRGEGESTKQPEKEAEKPAKPEEVSINGEKTFFMKARIMAGQADLTGNEMDIEDFKWLAKDEIQKVVSPVYWNKVKNMLVEQ